MPQHEAPAPTSSFQPRSPSASSSLPAPKPLGSHPVYPTESPTSTAPATTSAIEQTAEDGSRGQSATATPGSTELARAKITIKSALRKFPDFPIKGIEFVDIMPLFMDPVVHRTLGVTLHLQIKETWPDTPDVVVGLDARGFLFGPGLSLQLGASFAAVRKKGKLPGPCVTAAYEKEYGTDFFQMQSDAIKEGQRVLIVDDIIATGMLIFFLKFPIRMQHASADVPTAFIGWGLVLYRC
jgi:adenine phosphoribosyltransferase